MSGLVQATTLSELLDGAATAAPEAPALVHGDRRLSYEELRGEAASVAAALAAAGIEPGDAVGLLLGDAPGWPAAFFGAALAGAIAVPLNPRLTRPELDFRCRDAGVRALVGPARVLPLDDTGDAVPVAHAPGTAVVHWSSGTTGRPKRVERSHSALAAEAATVAEAMELTPDDRILCTIPLFHTYGLGCCLLAAVASGATLVLTAYAQPLMLARDRVLDDLDRERVTVLPTVPFALRVLAGRGAADRRRGSSLRLCLSAATALPPATALAFEAAFGLAPRQLYGTTETGTVTLDREPGGGGAGMVGAPLAGAEVRVVDAAGAEVTDGRIGDLLLRTAGMAPGYAGRPQLSRDAFRDGCFASGDRGRIDADGRVVLTGRSKRLIDVHGSDKVDPVEVEDVLAVHPRVREVAVVGAPSGVEGEEVVRAVVVPDGRCDARELVRYCRTRLAAHKVPGEVELRDELPRGPGGKVLRGSLV